MYIIQSVVIIILIGGLYFLPGIISSKRKTKNCSQVRIINIFLGWTFIGWVVALSMAFTSNIYTEEELKIINKKK